MINTMVVATLMVSGYSLWVRRDGWRSEWEIGANVAIAAEAFALVLMSPWAAHELSHLLYRATHRWNVPHLLGLICVVVAISAIIHHVLIRLTDVANANRIVRRRIAIPSAVGVWAMLVTFIRADDGYHAAVFVTDPGNRWLNAFWVVVAITVGYVSIYADWLIVIAGRDPRARETARMYLVSGAFTLATCLLQAGTVWVRADVSVASWLCACLAIAAFAYGATRSWENKKTWFTTGRPSS